MNLFIYLTEYSSDGEQTWTAGALHWTVDSATDEGRKRGQKSAWRIRRAAIHDAGLVEFDEIIGAIDHLCEAERILATP